MLERRIARGLQLAVLVVAAAIAAVRFVAIDAGSHSASDTIRPWLIELVPIGLIAGVIVFWIERVSIRRRG